MVPHVKYRVRQRGCSLTHSAMKLNLRKNNFLAGKFSFGGGQFFLNFFLFLRNWNWEKIIFWNNFFGGGIFFGENLIVRVKLGQTPEFQLPRQPPSGRKVRGRKEKERRRRRKNKAKFSGHYFHPRRHNVRAHGILSHQLFDAKIRGGMLVGMKQKPNKTICFPVSILTEWFQITLSCQTQIGLFDANSWHGSPFSN